MKLLPSLSLAFIGAKRVCRSIKKAGIFVQVVPCELSDVVSKLKGVAKGRRPPDDACGYKSLDDTITNIQIICSCLLGYVKAENLFLIFGETVQSLQDALLAFAAQHSIPHSPHDLFAPLYPERDCGENHQEGEFLAAALCKVVDAKILEPLFGTEYQKGSGESKRYEICWDEFKELQKRLEVTLSHAGSLK